MHTLVALAFLGPRPEGKPHIRHLDGNARNNHVSNLAYGTAAENVADSLQHGTHPSASKTHCRRGHEFTPGSYYVNTAGARVCKECKAWTKAESRHRRDVQLGRVTRGESYGHAPRPYTRLKDCGCDACGVFYAKWLAAPASA